jgi:cysteine synthase
MKFESIFDMIGKTPSIRVKFAEVEQAAIYLKLEGCNPTGSLKDRACVFMINQMLATQKLRRGMTLLDASSGNMACAIAYYGRIIGYPATVAVNSKVTAAKRDFLKYLGAEIHNVGTHTIQGNEFCRELAEKHPEQFCFLDQLHNWANPRAHYESTGPEILAEFPKVEMVVGSLGSGGTLMGVAQYLKEKSPKVKIVAVQSGPGSRIPGTGSFDDGDYVTPFIRKGFDEKFFDRCITITEQDAISVTRCLLKQGIFCGLQTGGVLHASLISAREEGAKGQIVVLSGDVGWKNMDKLLTIC